MTPADRALEEIDYTPAPYEDELLAMLRAVDSDLADAARQARRLGVSWQGVFNIVCQFGSQSAVVLRAVTSALETPPPDPPDETPEEAAEGARRDKDVQSRRADARRRRQEWQEKHDLEVARWESEGGKPAPDPGADPGRVVGGRHPTDRLYEGEGEAKASEHPGPPEPSTLWQEQGKEGRGDVPQPLPDPDAEEKQQPSKKASSKDAGPPKG